MKPYNIDTFPASSDLTKGIIMSQIGSDEFGTPLYLIALGFHPSLKDRCLHFFYAKVKINNAGGLVIIEELSKQYTDETKKRQDRNEDGTLKFENGEPVMIGIFSSWEKTLGFSYIYPDLQDTLNSIASTYPN